MTETTRPGRLNVQLTRLADADLQAMVADLDTNRTVLTSRAIRVYKRLTDAEGVGAEIVVHHSDGTAEHVSLIP